MTMLRKVILLIYLVVLLFLFKPLATFALNDCPTSCSNSSDCQKRVDCLAGNVNELRGQATTLSSQIAVMDNQINLTQARIDATKQQISDLTLDIDTANKKITNLQSSLDDLVKVLLNRMVITYEVGQIQPLQILATSGNANNFLTRLNYLKIAQAHDKQLIYLTQQAKNDYTNQKNIYEDKKKKILALKAQLESYTTQLEQNKAEKQQLLADTRGSESTYQSLLAQAQAQLAALSNFASSRFGGTLVAHQDRSDGWGKYFNQRDQNWGNNFIGQSTETIAAVGCLLTSYAMVVSHYGGSISPADVAANSSNFWYSTALFLRPGPDANGHSAQTAYNPSSDYLRDQLNGGHSIIVGLSYDGGPIADHWVVLRATDGDSFRINDPLYDGAMNVSLNDHYSGLKMVEARVYQ